MFSSDRDGEATDLLVELTAVCDHLLAGSNALHVRLLGSQREALVQVSAARSRGPGLTASRPARASRQRRAGSVL